MTTAAELALALTTAIAKWLKDARVFPDFALIDTYTVQPVDTPDTTPSITVSDANGLCTISIKGGITLSTPNQYVSDHSTGAAEATRDAAINQVLMRPP